jgi:hypothetical protein
MADNGLAAYVTSEVAALRALVESMEEALANEEEPEELLDGLDQVRDVTWRTMDVINGSALPEVL